MMTLDADVAVVGAGLSGLVAARRLEEAGLDVVVIEARGIVGGRTRSVADREGNVVDLGGEFVGPEQLSIRSLGVELGMSLTPTWDGASHTAELAGRRYRWRGGVPRLAPLTMVSLLAAITTLNSMARTVPTDAPWTAPRAVEWDAIDIGRWLERPWVTAQARALISTSLNSIFAAETSSLSLLHVLMCINSAGGFRKYMRSNGAEQERFVEGAGQLSIRIVADLARPPLVNRPVRRVFDRGQHVDIVTDAGDTFKTRRVVIAVPPTVASFMDIEPPVPESRRRFVCAVRGGTVLKFHLCFEDAFWRVAGSSGKSLASTELVNATFDHSSSGALVAFVVGRRAESLLALPPDERIDRVLRCLADRFGDRVRSPREIHVHSWSEDDWSAGCFAAYLPVGVWTRLGEAPSVTHGSIHFAGTETATRYFGAMDGAVSAGERAAADVITELRRNSSNGDRPGAS
jgi:monoamine oxidase